MSLPTKHLWVEEFATWRHPLELKPRGFKRLTQNLTPTIYKYPRSDYGIYRKCGPDCPRATGDVLQTNGGPRVSNGSSHPVGATYWPKSSVSSSV